MELMRKNYDALDLLKFIMSIMVVAIHTRLFEDYTFPWLRIAVPIFFIISSYFFFTKIRNTETVSQKTALVNFTKRNLQLYLFYFVLLLPITVYYKIHLFENNIFYILWSCIRDFVFGSTFRASWFITANVIGVVIIYVLSEKLSNAKLFILSVAIYAAILLSSTYLTLFGVDPTEPSQFILNWRFAFSSPYNSFPVALIWVTVGKCFADGTVKIESKELQIPLIILGAAMLFAENLLVCDVFKKDIKYDCYISLILLCPAVFALFKNLGFKIKCAKSLRKLSTMIYALHASIIVLVRLLFRDLQITHTPWEFLLTLAFTFALAGILLLLQKTTKLKVFDYIN